MEWREKSSLQCLGQTNFGTNPISKIGAQVFTVHTFRGSGKTYQQMGLELVEELRARERAPEAGTAVIPEEDA